ncbi:protein croquemort-like [Amphibalanus amphitrite]|uniref:protein croquemort-like n=1 Tax=Amphibalanus amphitrite TaxID=1232801 RepID=UPI001C92B87E|nr:protein croquemort-like [Amphibalanus amphitrite]
MTVGKDDAAVKWLRPPEVANGVSVRQGAAVGPTPITAPAARLAVSNRRLPAAMASSSACHRGLLAAGAVTLVIGVLAVLLNQQLFDAILDKKLELTPDSDGYGFWHTMPVPIFIKFYFWNVTNAEDVVTNHAKPILQQLGPYVYTEKHLKVNMTWNANDTITYMQVKTWHFEPDLSAGRLDDNITSLNVPLLAAAAMIKDMDYFMKVMFNEMVNNVDTQLFITKTATQLLFDGYDDPLLDAAAVIKYLVNITIPFDKFGWFYSRNGSNYYDGVFNMDTGAEVTQLGRLHYWNNTDKTSAFEAPCNMINGSAGELFHPRRQRDYVEFYSTDICRSLRVPYKEEMSMYGLDGYRFQADEMMFAAPETNPDNWCYCNGECPPAGLLNETLCRFGVPAFVSFPHMLYADPAVLDQTVGQEPNETLHNFNIDLEPLTGVPLAVRARFQINMLLKNNSDVDLLHNVSSVYLPMLWFENTVDTTPDIADQFVTIVQTVPTVMSAGSITLAALGGALLLAGLVLVVLARSRRPQPGEEPLTASSTTSSLSVTDR